MKTANDPRHLERINVIQEIFAWQFQSKKYPSIALSVIKRPMTQKVLANLPEIDREIAAAATEYPLDRVSKLDLAVLRLAVFELLTEGKTPYKVVIDEAIEIAKQLGSDSSSGFINGVLGNIATANKLDQSTKILKKGEKVKD